MTRDDRTDHLLNHVLADLLEGHLGAVLGGKHNGIDPHRLPIFIIFDRDLAFAIRPEVVEHAVLAHLGQTLGQLMRQRDGQRHQLGCFIARVAEHHALVARADGEVRVSRARFALQRAIHAQSDVGRLLIDRGQHRAGVAVKAVLGAVVADLPNRVAHDPGDIHIAGRGDLAHDLYHAGRAGRFAGHARVRVAR